MGAVGRDAEGGSDGGEFEVLGAREVGVFVIEKEGALEGISDVVGEGEEGTGFGDEGLEDGKVEGEGIVAGEFADEEGCAFGFADHADRAVGGGEVEEVAGGVNGFDGGSEPGVGIVVVHGESLRIGERDIEFEFAFEGGELAPGGVFDSNGGELDRLAIHPQGIRFEVEIDGEGIRHGAIPKFVELGCRVEAV